MKRVLPLVASVFFAGCLTSAAQEPYVLFEGTQSPDGKYGLAWGVHGEMIDTSDPDKLVRELDFEAVENYLVDLEEGLIIATLGSKHIATEEFVLNRGGIAALWRSDSRAVIIEESARFGSELVALVEIFEAANPYEASSDVIPLTRALRRGAIEKMVSENPGEEQTIRDFAVTFQPKAWVADGEVKFSVTGEVPKVEDAFYYEGEMTFPMPATSLVPK